MAQVLGQDTSPSVVAERYYGAVSPDGIKAMANPMVELGLREVASQANARRFMEVSENILKDVPGYKNAKVDVAKFMEPIEKEFGKDIGKARYYASEIEFLESDKKNSIDWLIRKVERSKGDEKEAFQTVLETAQNKLDSHKISC